MAQTTSEPPTPTPVASVWGVDDWQLASANCSDYINMSLCQFFCASTYTVRQQGEAIEFTGSPEVGTITDKAESGTIDASGNVRIEDTHTVTLEGTCTITMIDQFTTNLSHSPTGATVFLIVSYQNCRPRNLQCTITTTSRWTRTDTRVTSGQPERLSHQD